MSWKRFFAAEDLSDVHSILALEWPVLEPPLLFADFLNCQRNPAKVVRETTPQKCNSSPLKNGGWKPFLLGFGNFAGANC